MQEGRWPQEVHEGDAIAPPEAVKRTGEKEVGPEGAFLNEAIGVAPAPRSAEGAEAVSPAPVPIEVVYMRGDKPLEIERNWYFGSYAGPFGVEPTYCGKGIGPWGGGGGR